MARASQLSRVGPRSASGLRPIGPATPENAGRPRTPQNWQTAPVVTIRRFEDADWPGVWGILEPVFRAGDTYAHPVDITEDDARAAWIDKPAATYVAEDHGRLVGTYYLVPNHPGAGSHVCNCGYAVAEAARGRGVATAMCRHSQAEALRFGFRAMQYNLVASSNAGAVRLWSKLGFEIVGTLPGAFRHPARGYVDAFVMFKTLDPGA